MIKFVARKERERGRRGKKSLGGKEGKKSIYIRKSPAL
jgi:hypothetical protein